MKTLKEQLEELRRINLQHREATEKLKFAIKKLENDLYKLHIQLGKLGGENE